MNLSDGSIKFLTISIQLYFQQECEYSSLEEVKPPVNGWLEKVTGVPRLDI